MQTLFLKCRISFIEFCYSLEGLNLLLFLEKGLAALSFEGTLLNFAISFLTLEPLNLIGESAKSR
jgi:hypothetical protein